MKLISPSKIRYGNYIFPFKPPLHVDNLDRLLKLFSKYKFSPMAVCSVPAYWAPTINSYVVRMIDIDPEIKVVHLKEKNGRLCINIFTNSDNADIDDLIWSLKNAIDRAVCTRINMCKVEDIDKRWLAIPTSLNATSVVQGISY